MRSRKPLALALAAFTAASLLCTAALAGPSGTAGGPPGSAGHCARAASIAVPAAELQTVTCLGDLTTHALVGTGFTDQSDWTGLHASATRNPTGVPGIQVDGYFPDDSHLNATHGWNHDAQFVIRLPDHWNGGLVITGAPGVRKQYSLDFLISDWVLAKGYAFASTDKGNSGVNFYTDGGRPGDAIVEWNDRVTQLTRAVKAVVAQRSVGLVGAPAPRGCREPSRSAPPAQAHRRAPRARRGAGSPTAARQACGGCRSCAAPRRTDPASEGRPGAT
jgi:hypothetical protein